MKSIALIPLFLLLFAGCTVYRSEGRNQFESEAPAKISTSSFELIECKKENRLGHWFRQEFPVKTHELISSSSDLEIWRTNSEGSVEIKAFQASPEGLLSCTYHFVDELNWNLSKETFIKELQANWMTTD